MKNASHYLKATGRLTRATLKDLSNVSIGLDELESTNRGWFDCLHPDKADKEIIEADQSELQYAFRGTYGEEACSEIQTMHRRVGEATGTRGWPPGNRCHPTLYPHDNYHATTTWIDFDSFMTSSINREVRDEEWQRTVVDAKVWPTLENPVKTVAEAKQTFVYGGEAVSAFDRPEWAQRSGKSSGDTFKLFDMSTWLVYEATRRAGILFIEQFTGSDGAHNIHELMKPIPGNVAGYAYFPNGTCGDHVTSNIDSLITYSLPRLTFLRTHEHGHNLRLEHEFGGNQSAHRSIMSYASDPLEFQGYRQAGDPYFYMRDYSWPELTSMYGGEAAEPIEEITDPVDPPTPPGDDPYYLAGELEIKKGNESFGKFIAVPK